ncbi:hypothetical protein ASF61_10980 [Duganella sp. Leaf126]|nr:hypothetical protein ASF61_10980 [Duganella sp. Leaf126]
MRSGPRQPRKPGDFEKFVATVIDSSRATGKKLTIFGSDLFDGVPSTFSPVTAPQVNQDYLVGTGDELQIRGWGMVNIDVAAKVDRAGAIYIPRVGSVNVAGVRYGDLQAYLKRAVSKNFNNFDLAVSISQVRPVQIYVVGNVVRPGTYTLSAMSTLLNALFTSGGPDATGSMRNIEVKRGGKVVTTFDMYDILLRGDKSHDIPLQDGDVVYVPQVGSMVALTGDVKRPAIFEMKGPSSIADAVSWAGGFASSADAKQVIVEKNVNNDFKTVATLHSAPAERDPGLAALPLMPADVIRIFAPSAVPVKAAISNEYVRVSGEVKESGAFQIREGETLRSLVARLGVTDKAYVFATEVTRESVRRIQQERLDEMSKRFMRDLEIGSSQQLAATSDKDAVTLINAQLERQRSNAERMAAVKSKGRIVLELTDGDAMIKNLPDLALRDGDNIHIPRRPDTVDVMGAVFQQNSFIYRPNRTVSDYVKLAGGANQTADTSQMYILRADGTTHSANDSGWFSGIGSSKINAGDTIVIPEAVPHTSWAQSLKEWTSIFYQFGLGAAGLKVLKD